MSGVPTLRTPRLVLRPVEGDDAPFLLGLVNERGWLEHIGDRGIRDAGAARRFAVEVLAASYATHGHGLLLVTLHDGTPVGITGLLRRAGLDDVDVGFAIAEGHAGRGYATEAARAAMDDGQARLGIGRIVAITGRHNEASARVLRKLGLVPAGETMVPGWTEPSLLFVPAAGDAAPSRA